MSTGPRILDLLPEIKWRSDKKGVTLCPGHDDHHPSLRVDIANDGSVLMHCDVCQDNEIILAALGAKKSDLYPPSNGNGYHHSKSGRGPCVATYSYTDRGGIVRHQNLRYEPGRNGKSKDFSQRIPDGNGGWIWSVPDDYPLFLYRLPRVADAIERGDPVLIIEGEKDVHTAERLGFVATTNVAGAKKWRGEYTEQLRDADVVLIPDNDKSGREHIEIVGAAISGVAKRVRVLKLDVPEKGDLTDWFNDGGTAEQLQALIDAAPEWTPGVVPQNSDKALAVNVVTLDTVESREIQWIWHGRLARGKITVLDGDPGKSKSTITLDIAARISRGMPFPNEALRCDIGRVVILSAEDSLEDTIKPRLEAAGADVSKVTAITGIPCEDGTERPVVIPEDLHLISHVLDGADVLIVDPWAAFLSGKIDSRNDADSRRAMHVLKNLSEERNLATLIVRHLNKSGGGNALYRGGGSIGVIGAARFGLLVADHPEDAEQRVLAVSKCNLARLAPSLVYRVTEHAGLKAPMIDWCGTVAKSANDLLADNRPSPALADAIAFLSSELAAGERFASELYEAAEGQGIAKATLLRAVKQLGIRKVKEKAKSGRWTWVLGQKREGDHQTPTTTDDHLDHLDHHLTNKNSNLEGDQGTQGDQDHQDDEDDLLTPRVMK